MSSPVTARVFVGRSTLTTCDRLPDGSTRRISAPVSTPLRSRARTLHSPGRPRVTTEKVMCTDVSDRTV
jgi:hypothetical protein